MTYPRELRWRTAAAALLALTLVASACGDDDADSAGDESTESSADGSSDSTADESDADESDADESDAEGGSLGSPDPASGDPIKVGYVSDGQSAAVDNTDELLAAETTFEYVNEYLGGVGGHPVDLITCETKQDPAIAADCAAQFIDEEVVAVVGYVSGQAEAVSLPLQEADVPLFWGSASTVASDTDTTFIMSNGLTGFVHPAVVAREEGIDSVTMIVIDVPAATGPAQSLGVGGLESAGVTDAEVVAIAPGTPDMGPQIQAALSEGPGLVHIIGNPAFCNTALQALRGAGYDGELTIISPCIDDDTIAGVGDYLEGIRVSYPFTIDSTDPEIQLYEAVIAELADDPDAIPNRASTSYAFATVLGFQRLLADLDDPTREGIVATAKAATDVPLPLGSGLTMTCDGTAVPILPAVCTQGFLESRLDADGQPTGFTAVDPGDLTDLGG